MEELRALIPHSVPAVMWLGSELGWYQTNPVLWQSSLLAGQLWGDRGKWESKVRATIRVGSVCPCSFSPSVSRCLVTTNLMTMVLSWRVKLDPIGRRFEISSFNFPFLCMSQLEQE